MVDFADRNKSRLDTFSMIRFAEALLQGVDGYQYSKLPNPAVKEKVKQYAFGMLRNVIENPIVVLEENRDGPYLDRYDFSDANVIKRVRDNLKQWENK